MRDHSLFLCAEGTSTLPANCRTLLLSNFLHIESHIQETHFRITRRSYLYSGLLEDRTCGLFKGAAEPSLVHGTAERSQLQPSFSLWSLRSLGAHSQVFSMMGFKKIIYITLSSVSWLPKFVSYSL